MACFESGFNAQDTPHGFTKRAILRYYLSGYFRRHLTNAVKLGANYLEEENWSICYIDGFAWRGEYEYLYDDEVSPENENQKSIKGSPILALLEGLTAMKEVNKRLSDQTSFYNSELEFKAIHFVFNDLEEGNIENLKGLVSIECEAFGFQVDYGTNDNDLLKYQLFDYSELAVKWIFQITFVVGRFEDLAVPTDAHNIFSFIDPCGIAQIPLSTVENFIGQRKEAFINLMVQTILRVSNNPIAQPCIFKLFGQSDAAMRILATAQEGERELNEKYKMFVMEYENVLKEVSERSDARAIHFLFAKGKRKREVGNQFYMVFFTSAIKDVQLMKYAMQKFTQENGDNRFTDYFSWNGIEVPLGRKTTDKEEATEIWKHFQGQTVSLYEVQEWVVCESPFPYHSRALKYLEDRGNLYVDSGEERRRHGNFLASSEEMFSVRAKLWIVTFDK